MCFHEDKKSTKGKMGNGLLTASVHTHAVKETNSRPMDRVYVKSSKSILILAKFPLKRTVWST